MDDGYPTDAALQRLREMDDVSGALDFAADLWVYPDAATHQLRPEEATVVHATEGDRHLRLATGGWSGNDDVISALRANKHVWLLTWQLSARGGLHIFQYPRRQDGHA